MSAAGGGVEETKPKITRFLVSFEMAKFYKASVFDKINQKIIVILNMENWKKHIDSNPQIMFGKPVIANTRIPVDIILEKLGSGYSIEDILEAYPNLNQHQVFACLLVASDFIKNEIIIKDAS
jgi:uncharacterized protein (DUF433 family)